VPPHDVSTDTTTWTGEAAGTPAVWMLEALVPPAAATEPAIARPLERAAAAIARLDQALALHPLAPAFLYRARLDAVRRQAAVDGQVIDPWHLAAILEGLRLRMDGELRIIDRGVIFDAARHALLLHQWVTAPDEPQQREIAHAAAALAATPGPPLFAAARFAHAWLGGDGRGDAGGGRAPLRAALIGHWTGHRLLRVPVPLTGAAALRPDTPWAPAAWLPAFLTALADEAADGLQLLLDLERAWLAARRAIGSRRRHSRAAAAVDLLAAAPLISATSLAAGLGMAVKNAARLLEEFCAAGIAVEVTHRSRRRLFGLKGMAPLRDAVVPPPRPQPGRGRGRPPTIPYDAEAPPAPPLDRPHTPLERRAFDYGDLEQAMAVLDQAIRRTRRALDQLARGEAPVSADPMSRHLGPPVTPSDGAPNVKTERVAVD